ncbi:hypothetical protein I305_03577 [Cryptococcus gattii E566]|uniref:Uncharacterized protein n=2 Tax=Cryptococcus gattii TaxID=37769 RepID=E6R808_CRYGW|nr:Hypothetical Protein CGB_F2440C [Cryptococcus gattii WM276]ADV22922.1 Hypothetical Protein CGB_F2440C [Cryptococcus gattii WM276]KIR82690.1 hypothetical protein I306_00198 [Cryptococcus gattii EJB2]KIY33690.1 hypothetical protein I305_03577 [Cryptococcus gattii E566]KJE00330.1 hypothetical protein I311_06072 [Cryptococcus gattii NT-10]
MAALPKNHLSQHIPRKTSSPLSSPNSSVDRGMPIATTPSAHNGLSGSPATSSTLPLTDDESELTEEEEAGITRAEDNDPDDEAEEDNDTDDLTDNRMNRLGSQATTTSLTPPPSDPVAASPVNSSRLVSPDIPASNTHMLIGNMVPKDYSHNCNTDQIISFSHAHKRSNGDGDVTMRPTDDDGEDSDQGTVNGMVDSTEDGLLQKPVRHVEGPTDIADVRKAADPPFTDAEAHVTEYDWIEPLAPETIPPILLKQSSHAPPLPPSALRQLLLVEVKLAELRNCLYLERMEEAAAEEEMILEGTYPALQCLYQTLNERRERLHEGASRRFEAQLAEFGRMRDAERHLIWSTWTEERDKLHWDEFQTTWSKRRKLAREKGLIETTRLTKPVPSLDRPNHIHRFDWYQDAVPAPMAGNVAHMEALAMSRRPPIILPLARHASPAALPSSYIATGTIQQSSIVSDGPNIYTAFGRTSRPTNTSLEFTTSTAAI